MRRKILFSFHLTEAQAAKELGIDVEALRDVAASYDGISFVRSGDEIFYFKTAMPMLEYILNSQFKPMWKNRRRTREDRVSKIRERIVREKYKNYCVYHTQ
jgi:hypothetical protein